MTLTVHIRGDELNCVLHIVGYDDVAYDPTTHSIQLYDAAGNVSGAAEAAPTNEAGDGNFSQVFTIPATAKPGNWRIRWTTTTAAVNHSEDVWFEVKQ